MKLNISVAVLIVTDGTPGGQAVVQGAVVGHRYRISGPHDSIWVTKTLSCMNTGLWDKEPFIVQSLSFKAALPSLGLADSFLKGPKP